MVSSTPTPDSVIATGRPSVYQVNRRPSTDAPAGIPSTSLSPPEKPTQRPPSSVCPKPILVISSWNP
jgi:hypothetical protein